MTEAERKILQNQQSIMGALWAIADELGIDPQLGSELLSNMRENVKYLRATPVLSVEKQR